MKASVYVATSLDGFIARCNGSVDWLVVPEANEDYGFAAFMDSVDALVMGRNTFDTVLAMEAWPYGDKPVIVLTHRSIEIPAELKDLVEPSGLSPTKLARELDGRGLGNVYVDGGLTIQSFLDAGLIRRVIITTIPILIGNGIPLFGPAATDIHLHHVDTNVFVNGMVQSTYEVV